MSSTNHAMAIADDRHPGTLHLLQYFEYGHLQEESPQREMAEYLSRMAGIVVRNLPDGPELTAGLRKLLEAKDCFVRASLDAQGGGR